MARKFKTLEQLMDALQNKHGQKYKYHIKYLPKSMREFIEFECPTHGLIKQRLYSHLKKAGCPACQSKSAHLKQRDTTESFIKKAIAKHHDRYDYSKVNYVKSNIKVTVICKIHGEFEILPYNHINSGNGCNKCKTENQKHPIDKVIEECKERHSDKNYKYVDMNDFYLAKSQVDSVRILCPKHGEFKTTIGSHRRGAGCQSCSRGISSSKPERILFDWLSGIGITTKCNDRIAIKPYELDLYIPDYNLAIEINGVYWHSEVNVDKDYHVNKLNFCESKGIRLLQFYDLEILNEFDKVKSIIIRYINNDFNGFLVDDILDRRFVSTLILDEDDFIIMAPTLESIKDRNRIHKIWNSGYIKEKKEH